MKIKGISGLIAGFLTIGSAAFAVPSLSGPTGLVALPSADIASKGSFNLCLDYRSGNETDMGFSNPSAGLRMLYGISSKCEVSTNSVKYRLPFSYGGFAWAVGGGMYARFTHHEFLSREASVVYLAGTKAIDCPCLNGIKARGTVGLNYMRGKLGDNDWAMGETTTRYCPSVGIEANLPKKVTLIGEYMLTPGADLTSIALRIPTSVNSSLQLGLTNSLDGFDTSSHHTVMLGLNYKLGGKF